MASARTTWATPLGQSSATRACRDGSDALGCRLGHFDQAAIGNFVVATNQRNGLAVGLFKDGVDEVHRADLQAGRPDPGGIAIPVVRPEGRRQSGCLTGGETRPDHTQGGLRFVTARQAAARHEKCIVVPCLQCAQRHPARTLLGGKTQARAAGGFAEIPSAKPTRQRCRKIRFRRRYRPPSRGIDRRCGGFRARPPGWATPPRKPKQILQPPVAEKR